MHFEFFEAQGKHRLFLIAAAVASATCGSPTAPSNSVAGSWTAPGSGTLGAFYQLSLTQTGDRISGVACFTENAYLIFQDHVVGGEYPRITFTGLSNTFSGTFEADRDQIAGNYGSLQLRFVRSEGGRCEGARPLP
jgi:hypothetical protein